jgi:hypothetical protein
LKIVEIDHANYPARSISTPPAASVEANLSIQSLKKIARRSAPQRGRFKIYDFLRAVYCVYVDWKRLRIAKQSARTLANKANIVRRKGMSPIRILIEAALLDANLKQKSRWVRALEYICSENVSPFQFRKFVRAHGGLAGCAHLAASVSRKRARPGGDWNN